MPTQAYFDKYPPFPSTLPVAKVPLISFSKLQRNDKNESDALFHSCRTLGFFLLDLKNSTEGEAFLKKAEKMFDMTEGVNALPQDELAKYAYQPPASLFGYKVAGNLKMEDGTPDRIEFYNVGRDDILGVSEPLRNPEYIEMHRDDIRAYMEQAHSVVELICDHLDAQLHLAPGTLAKFQSIDRPSGTHLRMLRCPAQKYLSVSPQQPPDDQRTSLLGHTDIGSLTILFNITGGLQLLNPSTSRWEWVKPQPNCAIINLGDAMVEWTAGILRSNMHRVAFAPGEQGRMPRYSLAYLVRPEAGAPMKRLAGGGSLIPGLEEGEEENGLTAGEWEVKKA
ncbi:Oxidoreductase vrtI, partial [Lachnellula suecica]